MFSTLPKTHSNFSVTFILSFANVFNLDQSNILLFGKESTNLGKGAFQKHCETTRKMLEIIIFSFFSNVFLLFYFVSGTNVLNLYHKLLCFCELVEIFEIKVEKESPGYFNRFSNFQPFTKQHNLRLVQIESICRQQNKWE